MSCENLTQIKLKELLHYNPDRCLAEIKHGFHKNHGIKNIATSEIAE